MYLNIIWFLSILKNSKNQNSNKYNKLSKWGVHDGSPHTFIRNKIPARSVLRTYVIADCIKVFKMFSPISYKLFGEEGG